MIKKEIFKLAFLLGIFTYLLLLITGIISVTGKLGTPEYMLIIFAVLIATDFFEKLAEFSLSKEGVSFRLNKVETRQDTQGDILRAIQVALKGLVTKYEYGHLRGLSQDKPYMCKYGNIFFDEVKRLDAISFIAPMPAYSQRGFNAIKEDNELNQNEFDLKKYLLVTLEGREYLRASDLLKDPT